MMIGFLMLSHQQSPLFYDRSPTSKPSIEIPRDSKHDFLRGLFHQKITMKWTSSSTFNRNPHDFPFNDNNNSINVQ